LNTNLVIVDNYAKLLLMGELLSYLAGIIDGEGSIGFYSEGKGRGRRLTIEANMTDRVIIELLQSMFGGSVRHRSPQGLGKKDSWHWRVSHKKARAALIVLRPYLLLKGKGDQFLDPPPS
jgi:hypothetical protein